MLKFWYYLEDHVWFQGFEAGIRGTKGKWMSGNVEIQLEKFLIKSN